MARARLQPRARIFSLYPTADLQATRIGRQCLTRGAIIGGAQLDHMATNQRVFSIQLGIIACGPITLKICLQAGAIVTQSAADDLLHLTSMEIDTGAK